MIARNPQLFIRHLAAKFPHPAIERLVDWSAQSALQGNQEQQQ
jgi:hypothetical protein